MDAMLPDLDRGGMLNAVGHWNQWLTPIAAMLTRFGDAGQGADQCDHTWLSTTCRAESAIGPTARSQRIFTHAYDFTTLQAWDGTFFLRSGPWLYPFPGFRRGVPPRLSRFKHPSRVQCPERAVRYHGFAALGRDLRDGVLAPRQLYVDLRWSDDGRQYRYLAPARYVNFGEVEGRAYVQPVIGPLPWRDGDQWRVAEAAFCLMDDGPVEVEFVVRRPASGLALRLGMRARLSALHRFLPGCDEFVGGVRHQAQCRFYSYLPGPA